MVAKPVPAMSAMLLDLGGEAPCAATMVAKPVPAMSAMLLDLGGDASSLKVRSHQSSHHRSSSEVHVKPKSLGKVKPCNFTSGKNEEQGFLPMIASPKKKVHWRSLSLERSCKS